MASLASTLTLQLDKFASPCALQLFQTCPENYRQHCLYVSPRVMRIPLQLLFLGLGIATTTLLFEGAKRAMSGKHKRSPKQGDSPSAKEARRTHATDDVTISQDSKPSDKEIAAAEAARARLRGDHTCAASVRNCSKYPQTQPASQLRPAHFHKYADIRRKAARRS